MTDANDARSRKQSQLPAEITAAVDRLRQSERGRWALRAIWPLVLDGATLDERNVDAVCRLLTLGPFGSHTGSVIDAVRPYADQEGQV